MSDTHDNDNSTWTSLGFQTLLILNRLQTTRQLAELEQLPERNEAEQKEHDQDRGREQAHKAERHNFADVG